MKMTDMTSIKLYSVYCPKCANIIDFDEFRAFDCTDYQRQEVAYKSVKHFYEFYCSQCKTSLSLTVGLSQTAKVRIYEVVKQWIYRKTLEYSGYKI